MSLARAKQRVFGTGVTCNDSAYPRGQYAALCEKTPAGNYRQAQMATMNDYFRSSDGGAAENKRKTRIDEEDTDQDADRNRHKHGIKDGEDTKNNGQDAEDQLKDPQARSHRFRDRHRVHDRYDTHHDKPCGGQIQHKAVGENQYIREEQQDDGKDHAQDTEDKIDPVFFTADRFDDSKHAENANQDQDKVAGAHERKQRGENAGKTYDYQ